MLELLNLLLIVVPYASSVPLALYLGSVLENLKNYGYYKNQIIKKKKDDDAVTPTSIPDVEDLNPEKEEKSKFNNTLNSSIHSNSNNKFIFDDTNTKQNKIPRSIRDCFDLHFINLTQPSKFYTYYTRFALYFIFLLLIIVVSKCILPELMEVFTLQFWIPSLLTLKNSLIGFVISMAFGHPWLDNPFLQMYTLNKYLHSQSNYRGSGDRSRRCYGGCCCRRLRGLAKKSSLEEMNASSDGLTHTLSDHASMATNNTNNINTNTNINVSTGTSTCTYTTNNTNTPTNTNTNSNTFSSSYGRTHKSCFCSLYSNSPAATTNTTNTTKSYQKEYLPWNPKLHFHNERKAFILDISRLICSCILIPVVEELVFRYIFYRFIIGGFNYRLVSFSTWRWTAAILSNIAITHVFYIRCYDQGEEWISGLVNGYLCTFSMIKQGRWNASVNTHCLINLFVGLFVLTTKKYKYWY